MQALNQIWSEKLRLILEKKILSTTSDNCNVSRFCSINFTIYKTSHLFRLSNDIISTSIWLFSHLYNFRLWGFQKNDANRFLKMQLSFYLGSNLNSFHNKAEATQSEFVRFIVNFTKRFQYRAFAWKSAIQSC